jgi:putative transposon-encoded protein
MAAKSTGKGADQDVDVAAALSHTRAKFEVYGEEMIEKQVKQSGNSGRVYLPPEWVGKHVKIIRLD